MSFSLQNEVKTFFEYISKLEDNNYSKRIINVNGLFGTGKTKLINLISEELNTRYEDGLIFSLNSFDNIDILTNFALSLASSNHNLDKNQTKFKPNELSFCHNKLFELLEKIRINAPEYYPAILSLYHFESEVAYNLSQEKELNSDIYKHLEAIASQLFPKKSEIRLLTNLYDICSESFIVDLLYYFYPKIDDQQFVHNYLDKPAPKKVYIIIDNFDKFFYPICIWFFESLFKYCYEKKFSEFIGYNISFVGKEIKISDFIDFRFVIASRKILTNENYYFSGSSFLQSIDNLRLEPFADSDIRAFIDNSGFDSRELLESAKEVTFGIPYLLGLWIELIRLGSFGDDVSYIYQKTMEIITNERSDKHKDWIRCASFLDDITPLALRVFPLISNEYQDAYNYLINSTDLCYYKDIEYNRLNLYEPIKKLMNMNTFYTSQTLENKLKKIAEDYELIKNNIEKFSIEEIDVLRELAYFKRFDLDFIIDKKFFSNRDFALKTIKKEYNIFIQNKHTLSLRDSIKQNFDSLNQLIDMSIYDEKCKLADALSNENKTNIQNNLNFKIKNADIIKREVDTANEELSTLKKDFQKIQTQYLETENEHITLLSQLVQFSSKGNVIPTITLFITGIVLAFVGIYSYDIFNNLLNQNPEQLLIVKNICYSSSGISFLLTFLFLFRIIMSKSKTQDLEDLKESIKQAENNKTQFQTNLKEIKEGSIANEKKVKENQKQLLEFYKEIESMREKLFETFN